MDPTKITPQIIGLKASGLHRPAVTLKLQNLPHLVKMRAPLHPIHIPILLQLPLQHRLPPLNIIPAKPNKPDHIVIKLYSHSYG